MRSARHTYRFIGDCASLGMANLRHLQTMIDRERSISRASFVKWAHPGDRAEWERGAGYATHAGRDLTAARDWHLAYARSTWAGVPCVYLTWSGYEVIFVSDQKGEPRG